MQGSVLKTGPAGSTGWTHSGRDTPKNRLVIKNWSKNEKNRSREKQLNRQTGETGHGFIKPDSNFEL